MVTRIMLHYAVNVIFINSITTVVTGYIFLEKFSQKKNSTKTARTGILNLKASVEVY